MNTREDVNQRLDVIECRINALYEMMDDALKEMIKICNKEHNRRLHDELIEETGLTEADAD